MVSDILNRTFEVLMNGIIYIIEIALNILLSIFGLFSRLYSIVSYLIPNLPPRIGASFSSDIKEKTKKLMEYAGIEGNVETFLGYITIYCIVLGMIFFAASFLITPKFYISLIIGMLSFICGFMVAYIVLSITIDKRARSIEEVLPDFLSLVSQNIGAGMTTYDAIKASARPEFGPLSEEIYRISRDMFSGIPMETALLKMTNRIRSEKVERVVRLMIEGLKAGGQIQMVLQEISRDLQREQGLMKRMRVETTSQVAFIIIGVIFGAPVLFAVSIQFIELFDIISKEIHVSEIGHAYMQSSFISLKEISITAPEFFNYAIIILFILSFFGGIVLGLIRHGKILTGSNLIFILVLVFLSLSVFLLVKSGISSLFREMFPIG